VATTRKAMRSIESAHADPELVTALLASRSDAEASVAFSLLRYSVSDRELVQMANLREILQLLPTGPFRTGECLELLGKAAGYEATGWSYRKLFESEGGRVFGVEFVGDGHNCKCVVIHTPKGRVPLMGGDWASVNESLLPLLLRHSMLLDAILEGLELLGCPLAPPIYVTADDFLAEHHPQNLRETLGGPF
jgi:hypothetical protein